MERVTGIEPVSAAWEAAVLPLNYTRPDSGKPIGGAHTPVGRSIASPQGLEPVANLFSDRPPDDAPARIALPDGATSGAGL
jgi:hypothetical protein